MDRHSITHLIVDTVPQIYEAQAGPQKIQIKIDNETAELFSLIPCSPALRAYFEECAQIWTEIRPLTEGQITQSLEREWIQQKFATAWLKSRTKISSWDQVIDYARRLSRRTTENQQLSKTLVIEPGTISFPSTPLNDSRYFKVLDWLGSNQLTFFRVDEQLMIKSLEAISLTDIQELENYRFYPDFLHPVINTVKGTESVVVHVSSAGDILIADRAGIIASKRKGRWKIYDVDHVIESMGQILDQKLGKDLEAGDPTCVACSLFQILFDISFKRHGGLLVIDRPESFEKYVMKGIERSPDSPLGVIFTHSTFNGLEFSSAESRKLVELSAVDGALLLDTHGNLMQVGSVIVSHSSAKSSFGTRDTAAYSAAKFGATSFKISADGEVSIFFTTPTSTDDQVHRLNFL